MPSTSGTSVIALPISSCRTSVGIGWPAVVGGAGAVGGAARRAAARTDVIDVGAILENVDVNVTGPGERVGVCAGGFECGEIGAVKQQALVGIGLYINGGGEIGLRSEAVRQIPYGAMSGMRYPPAERVTKIGPVLEVRPRMHGSVCVYRSGGLGGEAKYRNRHVERPVRQLAD